MRATPPGRLFLAILFFPGLAGFAGCSRHPEVTVRNHSGVTITEVEISGTGFSKKLGDIGPGHHAKTAVSPAADSGLRVAFDANGQGHSPPEDGYLEASPHCRVTATVAPDFTVKVESSIGP
jgi:hypothetical protein